MTHPQTHDCEPFSADTQDITDTYLTSASTNTAYSSAVCNQWSKIEVELLARTLLEVIREGCPLDWNEVSATIGTGGRTRVHRANVPMDSMKYNDQEHISPDNCKLKFDDIQKDFQNISQIVLKPGVEFSLAMNRVMASDDVWERIIYGKRRDSNDNSNQEHSSSTGKFKEKYARFRDRTYSFPYYALWKTIFDEASWRGNQDVALNNEKYYEGDGYQDDRRNANDEMVFGDQSSGSSGVDYFLPGDAGYISSSLSPWSSSVSTPILAEDYRSSNNNNNSFNNLIKNTSRSGQRRSIGDYVDTDDEDTGMISDDDDDGIEESDDQSLSYGSMAKNQRELSNTIFLNTEMIPQPPPASRLFSNKNRNRDMGTNTNTNSTNTNKDTDKNTAKDTTATPTRTKSSENIIEPPTMDKRKQIYKASMTDLFMRDNLPPNIRSAALNLFMRNENIFHTMYSLPQQQTRMEYLAVMLYIAHCQAPDMFRFEDIEHFCRKFRASSSSSAPITKQQQQHSNHLPPPEGPKDSPPLSSSSSSYSSRQ